MYLNATLILDLAAFLVPFGTMGACVCCFDRCKQGQIVAILLLLLLRFITNFWVFLLPALLL